MDAFIEDLMKLVIAILLGSLIGLEREWNTKIGGFRTMILIAIGSVIFTLTSLRMLGPEAGRVIATIVQGVGFLGAGILINDRGKVRGITTAATVWVVAALGAGVGLGYYSISVCATLLTLLILDDMRVLKKWIGQGHRIYNYKITLAIDLAVYNEVKDKTKEFSLKIRNAGLGKQTGKLICVWELQGSQAAHNAFAEYLLTHNDVLEFEFDIA